MYIIDRSSGERIEVVIEPVSEKDFGIIRKDPGFVFDWGKYKRKEVFKLCIAHQKRMEGVMCIVDHKEEQTNAIEIELLEVRSENVGKDKKLDRIAGLLIAFVCRESFKRGREGYIFFTPKAILIAHYTKKYHLLFIGPVGSNPVGIIVAEEMIARRLISMYLE